MTDKYRERLDEEIGTLPPSTVDVDAIVRRQRRFIRAQRAGVVAAAGFVAAALVTGIGILQQAGGVRGPDVAVKPSASGNPRQAEAQRLTAELRPILDELLPGAGYLPLTVPDEPTGDPLVFADRGAYFFAAAQVRDAKGTGAFQIYSGDVSGVYGDAACPDQTPLDVQISCDSITAPDGATVIRLTMTREKYQRFFIYVHRGGGKDVAVEITNGIRNYVAQRSTPPLTRDQTVSVAADPSLSPAF